MEIGGYETIFPAARNHLRKLSHRLGVGPGEIVGQSSIELWQKGMARNGIAIDGSVPRLGQGLDAVLELRICSGFLRARGEWVQGAQTGER